MEQNRPGTSSAIETIQGDKIIAGNVSKIGINYGTVIVGESKSSSHTGILQQGGSSVNEVLLTEAKKHCIHESILKSEHVSKPINIAKLQIVRNQKVLSSDEIGHSHRREELREIISKPPSGDILAKHLFIEAKNSAALSAEKMVFDTDEAKENYINVKGNVVSVIGQAGIGKTTLTKVLLKRVVNDGLFVPKPVYVFYLKFRDVDYEADIYLLDLLTSSLDFPSTQNEETRNEILNQLSESDGVFIIMDGLDEARLKMEFSLSQNKTCRKLQIADKSKAENFIMNILRGDILPKAKKLVTSRPGMLSELPKDCKPDFTVQIVGLDNEGQQQLCQDICGNQSEQVFQFIQSHPNLHSYCYVPVICTLVMYCVNQIKSTKEKDSITMTDIMSYVLYLFKESSHSRGGFDEKKLASLAWKGFANKKIVFDEEDLKNAKLTMDELDMFFNISCQTNDAGDRAPQFVKGTKKCTYFSHLILQEYFAALWLRYFISKAEFEKFVDYNYNLSFLEKVRNVFQTFKRTCYVFSDSRFQIVTNFLFGLFNKSTSAYLETVFSQFSSSSGFLNQKQMKRFVLKVLQESPDFETQLQIYSLVYENHDDDLVLEIAELLGEQIQIKKRIFSNDIPGFLYVLQANQSPFSLIVRGFNFFVGDSLQHLNNGLLSTKIQPSKEKYVFVRYEKLDDQKVAFLQRYCLANAETFELTDCEMESRQLEALMSAIEHRDAPLPELHIWRIAIGDDGFRTVASCVSKIENLWIKSEEDPNLTIEGIRTLTRKIKNRSTIMERLLLYCPQSLAEDAKDEVWKCRERIRQADVNGSELWRD